MLPHSLRIPIFLVRVALGLSLFYVGWSSLFNHALSAELRAHSLTGLYGWLGSSIPFAGIPSVAFAWALLVVGICITLGLFTRIASLIAAVLILISLLPGINFAKFSPTQFINDEMVALFALLVLIFSKAGTYLGADKLIRHARRKKEL